MKSFIDMDFVGVAISTTSTGIFWFIVIMEVALLIMPIVSFRYLKLKLRPSNSETVRMLQIKLTRRTRTNVFKFGKSKKDRSGFAFSQQEGYGALITDGTMLPSTVRDLNKFNLKNFFLYLIFKNIYMIFIDKRSI